MSQPMCASLLLLAALLAVGAGCARTQQVDRSDTVLSAHSWKVYDDDTLILDVSDTPGPILSTASLPPGVAPSQHPFLSASARSAKHEHKLRALLNGSKSLQEFLSNLRSAGYRVVAA